MCIVFGNQASHCLDNRDKNQLKQALPLKYKIKPLTVGKWFFKVNNNKDIEG